MLAIVDRTAFDRAWAEAEPGVAAFLRLLVRDQHAAQDLLQEVAIAAWSKRERYDGRAPFRSWLLGMARLEALELRRRDARRVVAYDSDAVAAIATACAEVEADDRAQAVRACVGALRGRAWELVRLRYAESLTPRAIAERLGLAANAVRVGLHRARTALEDCLRRRLGGGT